MTQVPLALDPLAASFAQPVHITHAGDGSNRLFVVEQPGTIYILQNGQKLPDPFLDITERVDSRCNECGLLSMAFPPDYADKGYFFVYYNALADVAPPDPGDVVNGACRTDCNDTVIARFRLTDDPNRADPDSEEQILVRNQPFENHNGGQIAFGPDGYLYIGLGDGGSAGDPLNSGQRTDTILGKLLRVEVGGTGAYTVPQSNPYVGENGYREEIWALGLRNPWRFAFDRLTGDLWIGDVGQNSFEEIDYQPASSTGGENYGWDVMEGDSCYGADECETAGFVAPVAVYGRGDGCSVSGGTVYRGPHRALRGIYLFGDYCTGKIWGMRPGASGGMVELLESGYRITSFGEDEAGELYVASRDGQIARVFVYEVSMPFLNH
jgi:glucose/arabinose dehydrogenase